MILPPTNPFPTEEKLSEKIDISPRHMCTIENGNSIPSLETFVKIAEILDLLSTDKGFTEKTQKEKEDILFRRAIVELA